MKTTHYSTLLWAVMLLVAGCHSKAPDNDLDANRAVLGKYHQVWSGAPLATLDTLLAPDFVYHFLNGVEYRGIDGTKAFISGHRQSFPDWHEEIVDIIAENDKVVTRYRSTGTHRGRFNGLDSTGRTVVIYETSIHRLVNGKLVEQWSFPDALSLDAQLATKK